jgi:hypothetical protein
MRRQTPSLLGVVPFAPGLDLSACRAGYDRDQDSAAVR